jgi:hypothetical protein
MQRAPGPIGLLLVVDDLVTALVAGSGGPGLREDVPVGDLLVSRNCARFTSFIKYGGSTVQV